MIVSLRTNEIFDANQALKEKVANNIVSDYGIGIKSARATDFLTDVKSMDIDRTTQNETLYWAYGQYPELGDPIQLLTRDNKPLATAETISDGTVNIIWRVVGIRFRYDGQPFIERTYQQIARTK